MSGITINSTVTTPVTLGSAHYPNPLTIASTGAIVLDGYSGSIALYVSPSSAANVVYNAGTIKGDNAILVVQTFGARVPGTDGGAGVYLGEGTLINAGSIAGGAPSPLGNYPPGTQGAAVQFGTLPATLVVDPGAAFSGNVVANAALADVLELSGTSATELSGIGTQFQNFENISFAADAIWTISGSAAGLASGETISGFSRGDGIVLDSFTETNANLVNGQDLVLHYSYFDTETIDIAGSFTAADFDIATDGTNTTISLEPLCYLRGTCIFTPAGPTPIENLAIGDLVFTWLGGVHNPRPIKWIARQSFYARFLTKNRNKLPVRICAGALGEHLPLRDLWVSPGHSILLGETLILARDLINGVTVTQSPADGPELIEYFHIEFSTHDCVNAEGVWAESFADGPGLRAQFHNAYEYESLFPDERPVEDLILCAIRPERGAKLEAALRPIVARARAMAAPGQLEGYVDSSEDWRVEGWARDLALPELPVLLEILLGDRVIGTVLARESRDDLLAAGKGRCAFSFVPPLRLNAALLHTLVVRRHCDDAALPRSGSFAWRGKETIPPAAVLGRCRDSAEQRRLPGPTRHCAE